MKPTGNFLISRINTQGQVGSKHNRSVAFSCIMCIRNSILTHSMLWNPLLCTCGALGQFPLITEKVPEKIITPFCWCGSPGTFKTTCDRIACISCTISIFPAQPLLFNTCCCGFTSYICGRISGPVCFTECMSASNQCDCFLIIHGHPGKCFADITGGCQRIRITIRSFRIYINQSHLNSTEWILQFAITTIALISQPLCFGTPVNILLGFPDIFTATGKTKGVETH